MAFARVQATGKVTATAASVAATFAAPPSVGNAVVVGVLSSYGAAAFSTTACSDNQGNPYTRARSDPFPFGNGSVSVYYCAILTASGAPFTVTVNPAVGSTDFAIVAIEVSGVGGGLVVDIGGTTAGIATTGSPSAVPTSAADPFVVALCGVDTTQASITVNAASSTPTTPAWTEEAEALAVGARAGEIDSRVLTLASGNLIAANWTFATSGWFQMTIIAFKATAAPAAVGGVETYVWGPL